MFMGPAHAMTDGPRFNGDVSSALVDGSRIPAIASTSLKEVPASADPALVSLPVNANPEPITIALLGIALLAIGLLIRNKKH